MKMFNNIANRSTNTPMMTWKSDEKYNEKQAKQKKTKKQTFYPKY